MGDKSPKDKQRNQKQKDVVKTQGARDAKSKQDKQSGRAVVAGKK